MKQSDDQNTVITDDGIKHIAVLRRNNDCTNCDFENADCNRIKCTDSGRKDRQDVMFVTPV